jgi:crotonobetainyl-CoA:carnitine CoA-transferase CaiB-like acyl-CoA transferase
MTGPAMTGPGENGQPRPLDGITVVACEQAVAAPLASRQLADLGARVIKIERPGGGDFARWYDDVVHGQCSAFVWLNRGKESVQLDLKDPGELATLHRILDGADVLVTNLAPAALHRLRLTVDELAGRHPDLIACVISGYPPDGPNPEKKAYDALVQAEAGAMSITGTPGAPAKVGVSIADIAAGSYAFSGVLAAIRHRDITGEALPVQVSLFECLTEWMAHPLYYAKHSGRSPEPIGTAHPTIAPYGAFTAADGGLVMVAVQNEREWVRLCEQVLDVPELAVDDRFVSNSLRVANRPELQEALAKRFGAYSREELVRRLDAAAVAWGRLTDIGELAGHAELATPGRWYETDTEGGPVPTLRPPGIPGGRGVSDGAVPALGQHTDAVLAEFARRADGEGE